MSVTRTAAADIFLMASALLERLATCKKMDEVVGEKAPSGISWPAAPKGTRHEIHFYSDRKSDSREQ